MDPLFGKELLDIAFYRRETSPANRSYKGNAAGDGSSRCQATRFIRTVDDQSIVRAKSRANQHRRALTRLEFLLIREGGNPFIVLADENERVLNRGWFDPAIGYNRGMSVAVVS